MLHKYISDVVELRRLLREQNQSYLLESELPAPKVYLKVEGIFDGETVVWNMCIRTIENYAIDHNVADDPVQFIDIKRKDNAYFVEIGLNVNDIDRAVIESAIIMIKNYKRLRIGRHEFGARSKTT